MDFGISLGNANRYSFFMWLWKAVCSLPSHKANSAPNSSPNSGQKGGKLVFLGRESVNNTLPTCLGASPPPPPTLSLFPAPLRPPSLPALFHSHSFAQRTAHQSVADGQQSRREPMLLWAYSGTTCFPAGDQSGVDGNVFACTNELDPSATYLCQLLKERVCFNSFAG